MSTLQSASQGRFKLPRVAFLGRTLAEYQEMLALDLGALRGRKILDVASGPGSFVAEALALGLDATACDPMYAQDAAVITAQGKSDIDACLKQVRQNPGVLAYRDIDGFYVAKSRALETFAADLRQRGGEGRYVAGALSELPFEDLSFDLVLTANFLMVYAPLAEGGMHDGTEFGLEFHRGAFRELARVTKRELRVGGAHTWTQPPKQHPYTELMMAQLESLGFAVELVSSDYDDGCNAGARGGSDAREPVKSVLVARRRAMEGRFQVVPRCPPRAAPEDVLD
jgi:SAM-dependent methyltransferase